MAPNQSFDPGAASTANLLRSAFRLLVSFCRVAVGSAGQLRSLGRSATRSPSRCRFQIGPLFESAPFQMTALPSVPSNLADSLSWRAITVSSSCLGRCETTKDFRRFVSIPRPNSFRFKHASFKLKALPSVSSNLVGSRSISLSGRCLTSRSTRTLPPLPTCSAQHSDCSSPSVASQSAAPVNSVR